MKRVLALNGGSSSLKYALFQGESALVHGSIDDIGGAKVADQAAAIEAVFKDLEKSGAPAPDAVGHRLVHGGPNYLTPVILTHEVRAALKEAIPFAPLHLPSELSAIDSVRERFGELPQVACFDTGFHASIPDVAQRFALPERFFASGVRRYGFHGLSYEYIVATLGADNLKRAVIAHLGSGSSLVAVRDGKSIDTTMAFTPTAGLVMGTRSGDLDPGVLIYLLAHEGYDAKSLEHLVNHESGLLALSQTTSDVKKLIAIRDTDERAALSLRVFCYSIKKHIGAMAATLGGIDSLVFTGGAGAHSSEIRRDVCKDLAYLGVQIDDARNAANNRVISKSESACTVHALATNEEQMIARGTRLALGFTEST